MSHYLYDWANQLVKEKEPVKLRMNGPYSVVASVVWQNNASKLTHIALFNDHDSPIFECGKNSGTRRIKAGVTKVKGPVTVTCCKCVLLAITRLLRAGKIS